MPLNESSFNLRMNMPVQPIKEQSVTYEITPFLPENVHAAASQHARALPQRTGTSPQVSPLIPVSKNLKAPRMAIKAKGRILFIDPTELVSVHAEGNYVLLQKHTGSYLLRATMSEMVDKLERYGFIRIHRSILVNRVFVEEMQSYSTGNYGLRIRGGKVYAVSRTYKKNLKLLADCWLGTDSFGETQSSDDTI